MTPRHRFDFRQMQQGLVDQSSHILPEKQRSSADSIRFLPLMSEADATRENRVENLLPAKGTALFVPEQYEPNYPYPLLIWLPETGGCERNLHSLMPRISTRNYFGLAFRRSFSGIDESSSGSRRPVSEHEFSQFLQRLHGEVRQLGKYYNLHSERIYLAGFGQGAGSALQLLLERPEWFAGAIALCGRTPQSQRLLKQYDQLRSKRVLLGMRRSDSSAGTADVMRLSRLLFSAGMHVTTRRYADGGTVTREMLKQINHWLMESICTAV